MGPVGSLKVVRVMTSFSPPAADKEMDVALDLTLTVACHCTAVQLKPLKSCILMRSFDDAKPTELKIHQAAEVSHILGPVSGPKSFHRSDQTSKVPLE